MEYKQKSIKADLFATSPYCVEKAKRILYTLRPGSSVIDLGCNTGALY